MTVGDFLFDASAGYPDAAAVKSAGFVGVIAYFSDSRPGTNFGGKPMRLHKAQEYRHAGLQVVSNYQYGKTLSATNRTPPDWSLGEAGGVQHAKRALELHSAAGGPDDAPIYAPVDDGFGPGYAHGLKEWNGLVAPFLRGWEKVLGHERTGIYCNSLCIDWALEDGLGTYFWQHGWGKPSSNQPHPEAHMVQFEIDKQKIAGIGIDRNRILRENYGQWGASPVITEDNFGAIWEQMMGPV